MKKTLLLSGLFLFLFSCGKNDKSPAAAGTRSALTVSSVQGYVVKQSVLSEQISASGTIVPAEETELHPEYSGRVVTLNLPEGAAVKKGALLLKIYDEDLKTQLQKLETQLKQAQITEKRLSDLIAVKGVSQQEYDLAALAVQTIKSDMELLRINIAKTELRAPYDGVLGLRRISVGAYVSPATAITTIRSSGAMKLDFNIPEKYSHLIRKGQQIHFRQDGSEQDRTATVIATEQSIDPNSRNLLVRATVRDSKGLLPGNYVSFDLAIGRNQQALLIPSEAIIPQARDKQVIVSKGGKASFVTVKTGVRQAGMVEITDGIQVGDTVCTTGVLFLRPNAVINFSEVE